MTAAKDLRAALVVVAVLLVSTLSASAQAIVVEGNRRVEADTIRSYFRGGPGDRLDAARIDQGLKALYATGLFQDVRISQPGGRLVVTVVEAQVINRVAFEGNKKAKDEQLSTEIQSKPRGTLSRATVQADVQRIIDIYRSNGRYDVRVEPKIIDLPNNRVDLVFEVNEGGKTGVKRIDFVGNRAYSNGALKDVIKTGESNLLSFLKTNDIYDPDRVEADRELLRRYYLKHGYADVRIVSVGAEFDPESRGFTIVFNIEEGEQYRFGTVDIQSSVPDVDVASLRSKVRTKSGAVYNAEAVERTVEETAVELAKRGYAFAQVRPRGDRDMEARVINLVFAVDEGARAYIERINVRGNTRTRDYVIRREFDIAEGDAYNRALMDRAERRLKNLNYFKTVKITNEPGSAPDRVVVNVEVEEQPTGEFSIAGGYSTNDGFISEVSVGERNLLGKGQYAKVGAQYGQRTKGFEVSFVEPYLLGYRVSGGIDVFAKQIEQQNFSNYQTQTIGGNLRMGLPLRDDLTLQLRYSVYEQRISLPVEFQNGIPTDGEASVAVKQAAANGGTIVSLVGYSIIHNTLDNNKLPTSGLLAEVRQDFAGVGGDVNFIRTTADARTYYEVYGGIVAMLRAQGGHVAGWGDKDLRLLDHFFMGPNLVRGFASSGIGPRDIGSINNDPIGGTMYWGTTAELQFPIWGLPKDFGLRGAVFADAGSVWDYKGQTQFPQFGSTITVASDDMKMRSAVGAGLIWESPFGPLRFDYAVALSKDALDKTQAFRFGGGTKF